MAYQGSFRSSYGSEVTAGVSDQRLVTDVLLVGVGVDRAFDSGDTSASARVSYGF